ncbi:unnamed protein product [Brassica oleracea]
MCLILFLWGWAVFIYAFIITRPTLSHLSGISILQRKALYINGIVSCNEQIHHCEISKVTLCQASTPTMASSMSISPRYTLLAMELIKYMQQDNDVELSSLEMGKSCVFTYDAVGSYEKVGYSAQGSGSTLIMPSLTISSRVPGRFCFLPRFDTITPFSEPEAVDLVNTVFASATERDIYIGDKLEIMIFKADDIRTEVMELRKD